MSPAHNNLPAESDERSAVDTAVDCYSESEQQSMEYGQRLRGVLLSPLLQWLSALPAFSGCGHTFRPAVGTRLYTTVSDGKRVASLICLSMHVVLDGLGSPLARCQDVASPRGSFTDTFADQLVVTTCHHHVDDPCRHRMVTSGRIDICFHLRYWSLQWRWCVTPCRFRIRG